jgi:transcription termination factor Rho
MSAEQQLERSVLEGKERDELLAISEAMGLKPASRTKKADLIDGILRVTGVVTETTGEASAGPEAPRRRGRATRDQGAGRNLSASPEAESGGGDAATERGGQGSEEPLGSSAPGAGLFSEEESSGRSKATLGSDSPAEDEVGPETRLGSDGGSSRAEDSARLGDLARDRGPRAQGPRVQPAPGNGGPRSSGPHAGGDGEGRNGSGREQSEDEAEAGNDLAGGRSDYGRGATAYEDRGPRNFEAGEPGNRRNRRRRGRDRGPDRDPQGGPDAPYTGEPVAVQGLLDLREEGFGFLRASGYLPSPRDVYISMSQVRRLALRKGDYLEGASRPATSSEKYPALLRIDAVNGMTPEEARSRPRFEDLTPLFPDQRLNLELPGDAANVTARIVDLLAPIGKGQRGLIVSPPKAGKTTVMKQIAHSIEANNPDVHLMVLLVDERPEEVTDMRRSVKGEVVASTFDRPAEEHTQVAELAIERAKRLVESGRDVVIILDGITRLARAYNLAAPPSGRVLSGGVDSAALYPPKKFFGAARNIEEGGSLTILATALVETGSRMDEVIFEEFKGTGNMELRLDRRLAERRLYPAIDVNGSSTRHEELLFDRQQLQQVWKLRRVLNALGGEGSTAAGLELLMDKIKATRSNDEFLSEIAKGPAPDHR